MGQRTIKSPEVFRQLGFWNEPTQEAIFDTHAAAGGAGGAGYMYITELARIGVQNFTIGDPDVFDRTNIGRVIGATEETIGRNKAEVLRDDILAINPAANVRVFTEGITPDNIEEFFNETDVALDATELSIPELGVMICRHGRSRRVKGEHKPFPVLNVEYVAHGAQVTSFVLGAMAYENYMGFEGGTEAPLDEIADQTPDPSRYLSYIPPYGDLRTLTAIKEGASLPSNVIGAGVAAQLGVSEALKHIRQQHGLPGLKPVVAPRVRWMDAYTGKSGETRFPRASYYKGIGVVALNNLLGRYERGDYTAEARAARGDIQ